MKLTVTDKFELQEAVVRVYDVFDSHDADAFGACFLEDGVFHANYGEFKGRSTITEFIRAHLTKGTEDGARHHLTNFVFEEHPAGAVVRCYMLKFRNDGVRVWLTGTALITMHMEKPADRWLVRRFRLNSQLKSPMGPPPA